MTTKENIDTLRKARRTSLNLKEVTPLEIEKAVKIKR